MQFLGPFPQVPVQSRAAPTQDLPAQHLPPRQDLHRDRPVLQGQVLPERGGQPAAEGRVREVLRPPGQAPHQEIGKVRSRQERAVLRQLSLRF